MRYDSAELRGVRVHPAGFLIVDARPTRTGVFKYRRADGTIRREYRPPEEVSRLDSITTLRGASVTDLHPPAGVVTPHTVRELEVGTVTEARMDGEFVTAELVVKRADAIELIRKKERVELSCGYKQRYDATPGKTPSGEPYDGVQRDIRYNHVALLPKGVARGGSECALRLDADDAVLVDELEGQGRDDGSERRADEGDPPMRKIVIKGISFDAPEQTAQAVEAVMTEDKQRLDSMTAELTTLRTKSGELTTELEKTKAKLDTAQADLDKEKKLRTDAADPAKIQAAVQARVALERTATRVLEDAYRQDGLSDKELKEKLRFETLSDRELQERVILQVHKDAKLEGKSADYVAARFDSVVESYEPEQRGIDDARRRIDPPRDEPTRRERYDARDDRRQRQDDDGDKNGIRNDVTFRKRLGSAYREDLSVTR